MVVVVGWSRRQCWGWDDSRHCCHRCCLTTLVVGWWSRHRRWGLGQPSPSDDTGRWGSLSLDDAGGGWVVVVIDSGGGHGRVVDADGCRCRPGGGGGGRMAVVVVVIQVVVVGGRGGWDDAGVVVEDRVRMRDLEKFLEVCVFVFVYMITSAY